MKVTKKPIQDSAQVAVEGSEAQRNDDIHGTTQYAAQLAVEEDNEMENVQETDDIQTIVRYLSQAALDLALLVKDQER